MNLMGALVFILAAVLWYLYHKLFTVVYVNALAGIIREIVICIALSIVILALICQAFGIDPASKKSGADQPSTSAQVSNNGQNSSTTQGQNGGRAPEAGQNAPAEVNLPVADFYGDFRNSSILDGSIFQTHLTIEPNGPSNDELHILADSHAVGIFDYHTLDMTIPMPEGDTFTCHDDLNGVTLTITLHPEDHSLEVTQQPAFPRFGTPYAGLYIDNMIARSRFEFDDAVSLIESAWELREDLAIEDGTIIETAMGTSYVYYDDECAYILGDNGVEYCCSPTDNNSSAFITLAKNDAMYEPQNYYAKIVGYNPNGEYCGAIQAYLTTMLNDSFGIYSETGYLSITQGEGCLYVVEYGTFISPDIVFTGTYYR